MIRLRIIDYTRLGSTRSGITIVICYEGQVGVTGRELIMSAPFVIPELSEIYQRIINCCGKL